MDLAHPLSSVIPSVSGVVLDVLLSDHRALSGRMVAKCSDGRASQKAVSVALGKLVDEGLVLVEESDHAFWFRINEDHLAVPALRQVHQLRRPLYSAVRELLEGWTVRPEGAWVVGPTSERCMIVRSDLEVLLVPPVEAADDPGAWSRQIGELMERTHAWTGRACTVTERSREYLASPDRAFDGLAAVLRRESVELLAFDWDALARTRPGSCGLGGG